NGYDDDCDGLIDDADDERDKLADPRVRGADGQPYDPVTLLDGRPFLGAQACYADLDADGWPVPSDGEPLWLCRDDRRGVLCAPELRQDGWDCNDEDRQFHPGAVERPGEPYDLDCDGNVVCFLDLDGDNYGGFNTSGPGGLALGTIAVPATSGLPCETPPGDAIAAQIGDCDDRPGDGAPVHPGAPEVCDGVDDDCDGLVDDADDNVDPTTQALWYADLDGDGHAGPTIRLACDDPSGPIAWLPTWDDCDDEAPEVHPGAVELCDGRDDDCHGGADDQDDPAVLQAAYDPVALLQFTWWPDLDGDGYGEQGSAPMYACRTLDRRAHSDDDCDDARSAVHPGAEEQPADRTDSNCDGYEECWVDEDRDGHGDLYRGAALVPITAQLSAVDPCEPGAGVARLRDDCADDPDLDPNAPVVFPGQPEVCNGWDDDCDHAVDQADSLLQGGATWYPDVDGDGHGGPRVVQTCAPPPGYVAAPAGLSPAEVDAWVDCDDASYLVHPGAPEVPANGLDDDCDGLVTCYRDDDRDGWAATAPDGTVDTIELEVARYGVICAVVPGASERPGDCDDRATFDAGGGLLARPGAPIHPGATEVCNGVDDDCDGAVDDDDNDRVATTLWYRDADGDGAGDPARAALGCDPGPDEVAAGDDCRDNDPDVHAVVVEWCDRLDDDCDGLVDDDDDSLDLTHPLRDGGGPPSR
ncbi:MAG TPA: putative metal-binding motif-containing protein, partial [Myxococcota bacterium]|nr:putative metal-binding motif-containing protein [Myxococcota bacterium]